MKTQQFKLLIFSKKYFYILRLNSLIIFFINALLIFSCNTTPNEAHYDFTSEQTIKWLGKFEIKIKKDKILFDARHGNITDKRLYDQKEDNFNFDGIYRLEDNNDNTFYFRFGWQDFKDGNSVFSNVHWINNDKPPSGEFNIYAAKVSIEQLDGITLCTIGDSQTWWLHASKLRAYLEEYSCKFKFVGNRTDIYGYPHEGEGGSSSKQLSDRKERIPKADYYTILLGTNDWKNNIEEVFKNITNTVQFLLDKYPNSKIHYLTPLPTTNEDRNKFNTALKNRLINDYFKSKDRICIIYIGEKMKENKNWQYEYIGDDGLHQTDEGVKFMAEVIVNNLQH